MRSVHRFIMKTGSTQTAEAALADEWVKNGDRLELQRRALRLSKRLKTWKVYPWKAAAERQPREVAIIEQPLQNVLVDFWPAILLSSMQVSVNSRLLPSLEAILRTSFRTLQ